MAERQALRAATLMRGARARRTTQATVRISPGTSVTHPKPLNATNSSTRLTPRTGSLIRASGIHTTAVHKIGILESADKPEDVKQPEPGLRSSHASPLSDEEYHERADKFFEDLLEKLEEKSEQSGELDIEYAAGVMNVTLPSKGTYVLNKQPPNKQIWLSSPESGPKRFDWVVQGESMEHKTGGETSGDWIYLRDGSSLAELLKVEIGINLDSAGREL